MPLCIIAGASNTGKSEYMYNKIMTCEKGNKQVILFVPASARMVAEKEYLIYTKKDSIINTKITSLERYVSLNVNKKKLYGSKAYLPDLAKRMLVKKTISENMELFSVFKRVCQTPGFVNKMCGYIDTLESEDTSSKELLKRYENEDLLKAKLTEMLNIYEKLNEELREKFVTSSNEIISYTNEIKESDKEKFKDTCIFFDGYNNFNKLQYNYITELLNQGVDVTITLNIDIKKVQNGATEIFNTSKDTIEKLKVICAQNKTKLEVIDLTKIKDNTSEDLSYLANHILDITNNVYNKETENVELILSKSTYMEIEYVAESIASYIKKGYRYKDIVVYTNDVAMYEIAIKKVFHTYNTPAYFNVATGIKKESVLVYLLNILKLVLNGYGVTNIKPLIEVLKSNMLNISFKDVLQFENYMSEFGIKGYMVTKPFTLNNEEIPYDLEKINKTREMVVCTVASLKQSLIGVTTTIKMTEIIYNHLQETGVIKRYEEELLQVKNISVNEYNKKKQVISKLYEVMDNICLTSNNITLKEYVELLDFGLEEQRVDTIPEMLDQLEISDINSMAITPKKIGYIIGVYDTGLPALQTEDSIFSDIELAKLKTKNIELKETSIDRNNMQLFNIYKAINKIREHLIVTVPASKMSGGSLRPSSLIQNIKNILDIKLLTDETHASTNEHMQFMNFLTDISDSSNIKDKDLLPELYAKYMYFKDIPEYKKILEYYRMDKALNPKTLDKIYKENINSSVSRLEQFERCPFAYYTKYILHLKEKKSYTMSNLDTGSFMHEVIEKFSGFVIEKNLAWQDIANDENKWATAKEKISEIVENLFSARYKKYMDNPRYIALKGKLKNSMYRTIMAISKSFSQSEFRPIGYEIAFDANEIFAPIEVELDNNKKILLRGKIDRVDACNIDNNTYLRIVDYKSSDKNLKLSDVKDGLSLQLMTYMWAMLQNKNKINKEGYVLPAAVSYFTISGKLIGLTNYEMDAKKIESKLRNALKLKGIYIRDIEVLKRLDSQVEASDQSYVEITNRSFANDEKTLPQNVFVEECNNVKNILAKIANEMVNGKVKICPNSKVKSACEYCEYYSMCRKNIIN